MPVLALWGLKGTVGREFDVWQVWRDKSASQVFGKDLYCGHFLAEEAPEETASEAPEIPQSLMRAMKIATFNINNINKRLRQSTGWLAEGASRTSSACRSSKPNKAVSGVGASDARLSRGLARRAFLERRRHPGAGSDPVLTRSSLPGNPEDHQARYIEAAVNGVLIACIYLPNGNPQPGPKFDYKLAWFERLTAHARKLLKAGVPVVIAGDYNVVPTDIDIYPTRSWDDDALIQPASRAAYARLVRQGWTDGLRELNDEERVYTFWHYIRHRLERDAGLRLDHLLLSPSLAARLKDARVDKAVRGEEGASDHAPVWVKLAIPKRRRRPTG